MDENLYMIIKSTFDLWPLHFIQRFSI